MSVRFKWPPDLAAFRFGSALIWALHSSGGGGIPVTITGVSPLSLVNAVAGVIESLYRYGWCKYEPHEYLSSVIQEGKVEQNGTPTPDAPVDIVCNNGAIRYGATGNNLAEVSEKTIVVGQYISATGSVNTDVNNFFYQSYIPVTPNTAYTLSVSQTCYFISISEYQADKTFIVRNAGSTNIMNLTITTGADTYFIRFGSNMSRAKLSLEDVLAVDWMLNKGDAGLPYEPFIGGIYADGTPEEIVVQGKNLWNGELGNNKNVIFPAVVGQTYTITATRIDKTAGAYLYLQQSPKGEDSWSVLGYVIANKTENVITFTAETEYDYCLWTNSSYTNITEVQIEIGNKATEYQPPYHETAHVENLFAVGDYVDTQDIISGVVTRRVGIKVLDGTETWGQKNETDGRIITRLNDAINQASAPIIVTHGQWSASAAKDSDEWRILAGPYLCCYSSLETTADFKAFLAEQYAAGKPVIVIYPLAEEVTESAAPQVIVNETIVPSSEYIGNIVITTAKAEWTTPDVNHPLDIICNNGVVTVNGALGPVETITISANNVDDQTFTVVDLLGVGDYKDMEEVVSGAVTRKCAVCVYDGTQSVGSPYMSTTGGLDVGATIVYYTGGEVIEQTSTHKLTVADGDNTITSSITGVEMQVTYPVSQSNSLVGHAIVGKAKI